MSRPRRDRPYTSPRRPSLWSIERVLPGSFRECRWIRWSISPLPSPATSPRMVCEIVRSFFVPRRSSCGKRLHSKWCESLPVRDPRQTERVRHYQTSAAYSRLLLLGVINSEEIYYLLTCKLRHLGEDWVEYQYDGTTISHCFAQMRIFDSSCGGFGWMNRSVRLRAGRPFSDSQGHASVDLFLRCLRALPIGHHL